MDARLSERLDVLESHREISNLQGRFNHYQQSGQLKDKLDELFAFDNPKVCAELADSGTWVGADNVRSLFRHLGSKYAMRGALMVHMLTSPVIEVLPGNQVAKGMWNSIGSNTFKNAAGQLEAMWQVGKYDLTYCRSGGRWRYLEFRWNVIFRSPYKDGWVLQPLVEGLHEPGFPPPGVNYAPYDPERELNRFGPPPPEPV